VFGYCKGKPVAELGKSPGYIDDVMSLDGVARPTYHTPDSCKEDYRKCSSYAGQEVFNKPAPQPAEELPVKRTRKKKEE